MGISKFARSPTRAQATPRGFERGTVASNAKSSPPRGESPLVDAMATRVFGKSATIGAAASENLGTASFMKPTKASTARISPPHVKIISDSGIFTAPRAATGFGLGMGLFDAHKSVDTLRDPGEVAINTPVNKTDKAKPVVECIEHDSASSDISDNSNAESNDSFVPGLDDYSQFEHTRNIPRHYYSTKGARYCDGTRVYFDPQPLRMPIKTIIDNGPPPSYYRHNPETDCSIEDVKIDHSSDKRMKYECDDDYITGFNPDKMIFEDMYPFPIASVAVDHSSRAWTNADGSINERHCRLVKQVRELLQTVELLEQDKLSLSRDCAHYRDLSEGRHHHLSKSKATIRELVVKLSELEGANGRLQQVFFRLGLVVQMYSGLRYDSEDNALLEQVRYVIADLVGVDA